MQFLAEVALMMCIGSVASAQEKDAHTLVGEANRAFADGDYATALETYQAAELVLPESSELAYNRGVASYMLGDYAGARDALNRSLMTHDVGLEVKAKFNLGNVAYTLALGKRSTPGEAIDLLKTAMVHYRDAIDLDPHDDDARANMELAERMIRDLLEKLKQQQAPQQGQDDRQERQQDGQGQQQQGEQQAGEENAGPEQQQQERPRQEPDDRMTAQEVERLLQAVRDKERQRRKDLARRRVPRRIPVTKDW